MRLVALLSARVPTVGAFAPDELRIGVHTPVEHQARQAILAGAEQLIIRSEMPSPVLVRAAERLSRESGVPVLLVADGPDLTRHIEKDDHVLMIAAQMILPQSAMESLAAASAPALLVTPTEPATEHFERIDGRHVWAGGALLPGDMLLATIDMLGEWDLELTLLRRAVQQGAQRIELAPDLATSGRLVRIDARTDAERALAALSQSGFADEPGQDALSTVLAPVGRYIVAQLTRLEVRPEQLCWAAALLSVLGVTAATADWPRIALIFALVAEAALGLHRGCAQVMLRRRAPLWLQVLVKGASLAVLGVIGGRLGEGSALALAGAGLPLGLIAVQSIADTRDKSPTSAAPLSARSSRWTRLTTAMALTIALVGSLGGMTVEAFILIGLCAFGTIAARLLAPGEKRI